MLSHPFSLTFLRTHLFIYLFIYFDDLLTICSAMLNYGKVIMMCNLINDLFKGKV